MHKVSGSFGGEIKNAGYSFILVDYNVNLMRKDGIWFWKILKT